jgi:hypothetical protein
MCEAGGREIKSEYAAVRMEKRRRVVSSAATAIEHGEIAAAVCDVVDSR